MLLNQRGLQSARHLTAVAVLLLISASVGAQTPSAAPATTPAAPAAVWKTYSYSNDGFSVSFPADPQLAKQDVPTDAGTFELRTYLAQPGSAALYVGVCDYGSAAASRDPLQILTGAQSGAIKNVNGHLISEKQIVLGVYPGREFEAENDSLHIKARIYLVGTVMYQTLTAWPLKEIYPEPQRFLDSFQIIPRGTN